MSRTLALSAVVAICCTSPVSGQTPGAFSMAQRAPSPAAPAPREKSRWLENASLFVGLDGSKQPQDLGINANMGVRVSGNVGIPLVRRAGLGLQVGSAANFSDAAVHVLDQIEGTSRRSQFYATAALFQRLDSGVHWSLGYDLLHQRYYDDFTLGQVRGQAGYAVTETNDVGSWFTLKSRSQDGQMGGTRVVLEPITQVNGYLRHQWPTAAWTTVWVGVASGHHNVVWVLPDNSREDNVLVYGAQLEMPLSDRFGVTGAANFLTPTATGTVDAYLGLTWYPGRSAQRRTAGRYSPPISVANNPWFAVNMSR